MTIFSGASLEIECDTSDDELEELEITRYKDDDCQHKDFSEDLKPYKCDKSPWMPGKYVKLEFRPKLSALEAMIVMGIVCYCCVCICCIAIM